MHQEDLDVDIPNSTIDKKNCKVQQTVKDAQDFLGTPRTGKRERRQLERYTGYIVLVS